MKRRAGFLLGLRVRRRQLLLALMPRELHFQIFRRPADAFEDIDRNPEFAIAGGADGNRRRRSQPFHHSEMPFRS